MKKEKKKKKMGNEGLLYMKQVCTERLQRIQSRNELGKGYLPEKRHCGKGLSFTSLNGALRMMQSNTNRRTRVLTLEAP